MAAPETTLAAAREPGDPVGTPADERRRAVAELVRRLHGQAGALSRVHRTHPALYAKARRAFGSWREAVAAAGLDYARERRDSLRRGLSGRDERRAAWRALAPWLAAAAGAPGAAEEALARERPELWRRVRRLWGSVGAARAWADQSRGRKPPTLSA